MAGLIKVILSLQYSSIPAHLHFRALNPQIDWGGLPVRIPVESVPWPRGSRKRLAGVSSFGFSGTNAHLIVEEAPEQVRPLRETDRPRHVLALSARSRDALRDLAGRYAARLESTSEALPDICFTANAGRAHFNHRAVYVAVFAGEYAGISRERSACRRREARRRRK